MKKFITYELKVEHSFQNMDEAMLTTLRPKAQLALTQAMMMLEGQVKRVLSVPGTGRLYRSKGTKKVWHRASVVGRAPAPDTGIYRASWRTFFRNFSYQFEAFLYTPRWQKGGRRLEVGGRDKNGVYIAPRPHVEPAFNQAKDRMQRRLDQL